VLCRKPTKNLPRFVHALGEDHTEPNEGGHGSARRPIQMIVVATKLAGETVVRLADAPAGLGER